MRAVIWTKYGPPESLVLDKVEDPVPKDSEVLIKIRATTVTAGDCEIRALKLPLVFRLPIRLYTGLRKPKRLRILGQELSGVIEAIGAGVKSFKVGDEIFATTGFGLGAYAEYICLPETPDESAIALKPKNMTFEEAAAVPTGALEALHFLEKVDIQRGQKLLIVGAGGSIGTFALQIAKNAGAEVTAVDIGEKLEMLRSIGADAVVDYTREKYALAHNRNTYDVIFDVPGKSPFLRCLKMLKPRGHYLIANAGVSFLFNKIVTSIISSKKMVIGSSRQKPSDLIVLRDLIELGKLRTVIDRYFPLEQVEQAHRYVESGSKSGNVVIVVSKNDSELVE